MISDVVLIHEGSFSRQASEKSRSAMHARPDVVMRMFVPLTFPWTMRLL